MGVTMVNIGPVEVLVDQWLVAVPMRVACRGLETRVLMHVMPVVVAVAVDVLDRRMLVEVRVLARKERQHGGHQYDQAGHVPRSERFAQSYERHARSDERGGREDSLGAGRAELLCR